MRWSLLLVMAVAGCVSSDSIQCGTITCPADWICIQNNSSCAPHDALAACDGKADDASCTASGLAGACKAGICETIICGNHRQDPGESCDDGNATSGDGCDSTCRSTEICGNGIVDINEGCDCGDGAPEHTNSRCHGPNSVEPTAECRTNCTARTCGDGEVLGTEQCEAGKPLPTNPQTSMPYSCADFGFYQGTLGCNDSICQFDKSGCSLFCGDAMVNGPNEVCDGGPPVGSCVDFGYDAGDVSCIQQICTPNFEGCRSIGWREYNALQGFNSVAGSSPTDVWAAGPFGLDHFDGFVWKPDTSISGHFAQLWNGTSVYARSDIGIYRRQGTSWTLDYASTVLSALSGSGARVVAGTRTGAVVTSTGGSWADISPTLPAGTWQIADISVVGANEAFVLVTPVNGGSGTPMMWHWTGGTSWAQMPIPATPYLASVWGTSATNLYIGGYALQHWDGSAWSTVQLGVFDDVYDIWGSGPNDVYVSFTETVAHYDGMAWSFEIPVQSGGSVSGWSYASSSAFTAAGDLGQYLGARWANPHAAQTVPITSVAPTSATNMVAVGSRGFIMRFDGAFWHDVPSDVAADLEDGSPTLVVGKDGTVAKLVGARYTTQSSGTTNTLHGVWEESGASPENAWAVGDNGTIVHWDGTMGTAATVASVDLYDVIGFSANDVIAVGNAGTVLQYKNGAWTDFHSMSDGKLLTGVWGTSDSDLWVVGPGAIRHWDGNAWTDLYTLNPEGAASSSPNSIWGSGNDVYIAANTNRVLHISNGVFQSSMSIGTTVTTITGTATGVMYAGGPSLELFSYQSGAWISEAPDFNTYSGGSSTVYAVAANDAYMTYGGALEHFDGIRWTRVTTGLPVTDTYAISGTATNNVFVASLNTSQARRWNGTTWQTQAISTGLRAISAASATDAWAIALDGTLMHFTGTWAPATTANTDRLWAITEVTPTNVWAVGSRCTTGPIASCAQSDIAGLVLHYNGSTWSNSLVLQPSVGSQFVSVAAVGGHVFAAGLPVIAHYDGAAWTTSTDSQTYWAAITGMSPTDMFASTITGLISHWDGLRWQPLRAHTTKAVLGLSALPSTIFATDGGPMRLMRDVAW